MRDTFFNVPNDKIARMAGNHLWNADRQEMAPMPAGLLPPPFWRNAILRWVAG